MNIDFNNIRGLSLSRPWPYAFIHDTRPYTLLYNPKNGKGLKEPPPKRVENRSWAPPKHIKWLALHAAKSFDKQGSMYLNNFVDYENTFFLNKERHPHSQIFAICSIKDVYEIDQVKQNPYLLGDQCIWAFGPYCWVLENFLELPSPIECKGHQGLWKIPPHILEDLQELLGG